MISLADEERIIIQPARLNRTQFVAGTIFILAALYIASLVPTIEIAWVCAILLLTIYLFAFEVVGVDITTRAINGPGTGAG